MHTLLLEMLLQPGIDLVAFLCTEMADGTLDQLEVGLDGFAADLFDLLLTVNTIDIGISAELQVNIIRFMNQLHCLVIA